MGGKTKVAQRTKNNARPSSSGRSAELLGASMPAFVGFGAVENCGFQPVVSGLLTSEPISEEIDANVDANFQLILRKMSKKDPITKSKALQEFSDIVTVSDVDLLKTILPFWPRLYVNLATDVEHRVREGAQQAHGALAGKVGKLIAPYLKQMAPVWIASQYDSYAPAASIATTSFQRAFPPHKLKEVFGFCQGEILDYVTKILTVHTATTLSNSKSYTPDECEAKYQRTVACCLQAYAMYLRTVSKDSLAEAANKNLLLIENQKFWSFHKHQSPNVRSAWFEALSAIVQNLFELLEKHTAQLVNAVFQNLDESDPIVLPHLWTAILLVQVNITAWSQHVNWEKMLLPKLWKVLKSGSSVTYPQMLPFISKINGDILNEEEKLLKFYGNFFENLSLGLRNRHGSLSKSEITAIVTCYFECLQYVIFQLLKEQSTQETFRKFGEKLLDEHILGTISWSLADGLKCHMCIFTKIPTLLTNWSQNSAKNEEYKALEERFWSTIFSVIEKSIETMGKDLDSKTEGHIDFCHCLKYSRANRSGKSNTVKFLREGEEMPSTASSTECSSSAPVYKEHLDDVVLKICQMYLRHTIDLRIPTFIPKLHHLFNEFGGEKLYRELAEDGDLTKLLSGFETMLADGKLRQEFVVDMILKLYDLFQEEQKREILKKLVESPHKNVCNWIITRILSYPLCMEARITEILSQEKVKKHLVEQANHAVQGCSQESFNILHKCFFQTESGEILIDNETCAEIIDIISTALTRTENKEIIDTCGSFLAQAMPVICADRCKGDIQSKMFLNLFRFSVNQSTIVTQTDECVWEIMTSWQDSLSSGDLTLSDTLLAACSEIIEEKLSQIPADCMENLAEVTSKLILCSAESISAEQEKTEFVEKAIDSMLNMKVGEYKRNQAFAEHLTLYIEALNRKLTTPEIGSGEKFREVSYNSAIAEFLQVSLFKMTVVFKLCCNVKREKDENAEGEEEEFTEDYCDFEMILLKSTPDEVHSQILDAVFALTCGETLLLHGGNLGEEIEAKIHQLAATIELFFKNIPEDLRTTLRDKLFGHANQQGGIWANCLPVLGNCEQYRGENGAVLLYEDTVSASSDAEAIIAYINILQALTPTIPVKCLPVVPNLFENFSNLLISTTANRCLISNNFSGSFNDMEDRKIMGNCLKILSNVAARIKTKDLQSLYNVDIQESESASVILIAELANFLEQLITNFASEFEDSHWDFVRIALSSWVLSVSKSVMNYGQSKVAIFIACVYKLFVAMEKFVVMQRTKSSTEYLTRIVEEWEEVFAKDVHLVLLRVFMVIVQDKKGDCEWKNYLLDIVSPCVEELNTKYVTVAKKVDGKISQDDFTDFCLTCLTHENHAVRFAASALLQKLTPSLIANDVEVLNRRSDQEHHKGDNSWHFLQVFFRRHIEQHNEAIAEYMREFTFKVSELSDLPVFPREKAISYLLLWDFAVNICRRAPSELRSIYAQWIAECKFEYVIFPTLFRLMPLEVLKNWDSKVPLGETMFNTMEMRQIANPQVCVGRLACHIYVQTLRYLSVLARKWWQDLAPRQKLLVDKITTSYVSPMLCQEELRALTEARRQENMLISVHSSTREVIATYAIDDARLELTVTLPANYPLGAVKVDGNKQIGGRLQSRVVVMQLTIFLTHQNGTINDGLSLWKRNLDKKFEGVEECYVCYSVIHQDTCQLPKLTCKTCRKKFHGPCLYKWFSTSNKSTCPICRNIF